MKIGLDVRMIRKTGIGTYVAGLVNSYERQGLGGGHELALYGDPALAAVTARFPVRKFRAPIYSVREQWEYPFRLKGCDLWHAPHYNVPLLGGRTRLVVTIHDLIHWVFRKKYFSRLQAFYAGTMLAAAVHKAAHVITVSEHTRGDLIRHFDAPADKISVIYEGVDPDFAGPEPSPGETAALQKKFQLPENYFLYVGTLKPHKNVSHLVKVFRRLRQEKRIEAGLVVVGRKDRRYPKGLEPVATLASGGGIVYIPSADRRDLVGLYRNALALVHPSLYEGFGLTLLEAMACGTPVIASNAASLPEVAGEAAILIDPRSAEDLAKAMIRTASDAALRATLREKGTKNVLRFRWDETARRTAAIYEKVLGTR